MLSLLLILACQLQLEHLFGRTKASLGCVCGMVTEKYVKDTNDFEKEMNPPRVGSIFYIEQLKVALCAGI